jgi:hypothetical protein
LTISFRVESKMMLLVRKSESWTISKLRFKSFVSIQSGPKICQCIFYDTPGRVHLA